MFPEVLMLIGLLVRWCGEPEVRIVVLEQIITLCVIV